MKKEGTAKSSGKATTKTVSSTRTIRKSNTGKPPRLYMRATFLGFRRGKTTQNENQALVRVEGLNDRKEVPYYQGKRIVYIYKAKKGYRTIWGKISSPHGSNGVVKAKFRKNLPPRAIGATLRVMLYPQRPLA